MHSIFFLWIFNIKILTSELFWMNVDLFPGIFLSMNVGHLPSCPPNSRQLQQNGILPKLLACSKLFPLRDFTVVIEQLVLLYS